MKEILKNFVTTNYKFISKRPYSKRSFKIGMMNYFILLLIFLGTIWLEMNNESNTEFWLLCLVPLSLMIFLNGVGYFLFKNDNLKKYAVLISYLSALAYSFFIVAYMAGFRWYSKFVFINALKIILGVWFVWLVLHAILVWVALKKNSLKIRDKYGDYYVMGITIISVFLMTPTETNSFVPFYFYAVCLIASVMLIVLTFHFPRILPYWTGEFKDMKEEDESEIEEDGPMAYMEEMEDFELNFENIKVKDITKILTAFKFKSENVKMSDFLVAGKNKEYKDIVSFSQYFKKPGECRLLVKDLNIGIHLKEALIIISFNETNSNFALWFPQEDWNQNHVSDEEINEILIKKVKEINQGISYSSVILGNYSGDDGYKVMFRIH